MLYESFNTTTVIIEAGNYYNSVQLLVWVFIDNISISVFLYAIIGLLYAIFRLTNFLSDAFDFASSKTG